MLDSMDVVRPVGGGDSKKSALRVALTVASAVGLVTLSVRLRPKGGVAGVLTTHLF